MYLTYIIILILISIMFNIKEVNNYIIAVIILLLLLLNELYNCSINEKFLYINKIVTPLVKATMNSYLNKNN